MTLIAGFAMICPPPPPPTCLQAARGGGCCGGSPFCGPQIIDLHHVTGETCHLLADWRANVCNSQSAIFLLLAVARNMQLLQLSWQLVQSINVAKLAPRRAVLQTNCAAASHTEFNFQLLWLIISCVASFSSVLAFSAENIHFRL